MSSIGKRLLATTEKVETELQQRAGEKPQIGRPVFAAGSTLPTTSPGRLIHQTDQLLAHQRELAELRARLEKFDGSLPTVRLNPDEISASSWANRHEASYSTPAFARFKTNIEASGGNVQPILVRRNQSGEGYELIFGHRRHRATSELKIPVLAVIWDKVLLDQELFLLMERENRERADLSAFEQGRSYLQALDEKTGLFRSERQLSEAIGISRAWIGKTLKVARLPQAIVDSFVSPLDIKPAHAEAIDIALKDNEKAVIRRAEKLRQLSTKLPAGKVVAALLGLESEARSPVKVKVAGKTVGQWHRDSHGRTVITFAAGLIDDSRMIKLLSAMTDALEPN
ncbi:MAG: ParB/RepB/Spo0J family partition protein [Hyphomicrobiales bacterium]|nr:MAG: ParB/RepB/Spo0J family partition protein [Hyphomicrobiales bacterium]